MRKRKLLQLLAIFMLAIDDVIDDVILAISDLLRGKPAIDSSLLLGPSTDIGSILLKQLENSTYAFHLYGDGKEALSCISSYMNLYSNNLYIHFKDSDQREVKLCIGKWKKEYNIFQELGSLVEIPIYIKWLGFSSLHFYFFGGFEDFNLSKFLHDMEILPRYSTSILIAQGKSLKAITGELLLQSSVNYNQNPYIQYIKFIATNPDNSAFYIKTNDFSIVSFMTDTNALIIESDQNNQNNHIIKWQKEQISKYIEFIKKIRDNNQIKAFEEFIKDENLENDQGVYSWLANNSNITRYKELMLLNCIDKNETTKLESLLKSGVDHGLKSYNGMTPLCISAQIGNLEAAKLLLGYGADINASCANGINSVGAAVLGNNVEILEYLLLKRGDVNLQDSNGNTPLILSIAKKYNNLAKIILNFDPNIDAINKAGKTALSVAFLTLNIEGAQILLNSLSPEDKSNIINSESEINIYSLSNALTAPNIQLIQLLLENGAEVKESHIKQMASRGYIDIAYLLIKHLDFNNINSRSYFQQETCDNNSNIVDFISKYTSEVEDGHYDLKFVQLYDPKIEDAEECSMLSEYSDTLLCSYEVT